ncbi:sialate O-acetylesterase [Paenibacillus roseipurpureus]|uniref:Sialate O-acetylesterase n=1 Tax=Paenibacillus roseopurpureus TaxID=2918901 RepID=A0AA96LU48_9BACL|nr:sialate O-acetylesterase [Paenibacillus sp. MBLB1832]WNR46119.1 sialate O-acetylesterase [Paenibacillus sp. MBLB1832]
MHLFLLIGQSNMAGRGELSEIHQQPKVEKHIYMLDADMNWQTACEPIHFDKPELVGVGPGLSFARTIKPFMDGESIGLIPCAVGGTKIERWISKGDLYREAVSRARSAMQRGKLSGILWAQGESDSADFLDAKSYKERLFSLISDLRNDLQAHNVPFIASKLGGFILPDSYPYTNLVNEALAAASDSFAFYSLVVSKGLSHKGDHLHYDTESAEELGRRMAEAWLKVVNK